MINRVMKYLYSLSFAILFLGVISCEKDDNVIGEERQKVVFSPFEEKLVFSEYMTLPIESFPYKNSHFSSEHPAQKHLPSWLFNKYYSPPQGSTTWVDYAFTDYVPSPEVETLSNLPIRTVTSGDLTHIWGDVVADYLTPSKPETLLPEILKKKFPNPEEGVLNVIVYNYSDDEGTITTENKTYLTENFNSHPGAGWSVLSVDNWFNGNTFNGRPYRTMVAGVNKIPMAYDRDNPGSDAWLINKIPVDLRAASKPILHFSYGLGYFVENDPEESFDCMHLKVSNKFDGSDPTKSTWIDLSENSGIRETQKDPGYPGITHYEVDLSDFAGDDLFVGFNYHLPKRATKYNKAPLYYVDDVRITDTKKSAASTSKVRKYAIFQYQNNTWKEKTGSFYILQASDYDALGMETLSSVEAEFSIPPLLSTKYPEATSGDNIIIVYNAPSGVSVANEFIYKEQGWIMAGAEPIMMTDKYVYNKETGWTYESSTSNN